jgi:hypothetical protein
MYPALESLPEGVSWLHLTLSFTFQISFSPCFVFLLNGFKIWQMDGKAARLGSLTF